MQTHIYASFADPKSAERAAGALLDNGVQASDLTIIQHHSGETNPIPMPVSSPAIAEYQPVGGFMDMPPTPEETLMDAEDEAKFGISTTTVGDAEIGAFKGAGWGLGLGAVAALAVLFIPGFGLVIGGGALEIALGATAGATAAGAVAGAVTGYLKDQGFEDSDAQKYMDIVSGGGAILSLALPSGKVYEPQAWEIISKYNGVPFTEQEAVRTTAYRAWMSD